ncbi:TPA: sensor histidine kinase, partial [Clostridioides difficile]|nr:sensor histidine kinase [Clostridioides difficile]
NSRSTKGNGLGLAITKELVNAHKGTITANSILNHGTEFILSFPKAL